MYTQQQDICGEIWLTPRDRTVLRWIGEQYAVRLDTLGVLLGRDATQPTLTPGCVARSTVRRVIARWRRAGLVSTRKFFFGEPAWVWLTTRGLRQLDFGYRPCTPKAGLLDHLHMVNQVRLRVEAHYTEATDWRSERFLRREYGRNRRTHIPDAEIVTNQDAVIGVEVELTQKSRRRAQEIAHKLAHRYDCIWFFVNRLTRPTVTAATQVQPSRFRVYDVEQVAI